MARRGQGQRITFDPVERRCTQQSADRALLFHHPVAIHHGGDHAFDHQLVAADLELAAKAIAAKVGPDPVLLDGQRSAAGNRRLAVDCSESPAAPSELDLRIAGGRAAGQQR